MTVSAELRTCCANPRVCHAKNIRTKLLKLNLLVHKVIQKYGLLTSSGNFRFGIGIDYKTAMVSMYNH